jgi:hypothetical protein
MSKSKSAKWIGIGLMAGGFMLFTATWLSHSFWRFVSSLGLTGDVVHPILSWLGLVVMAIGLFALYQQTPPSLRSASKKAFAATALGIGVAIFFTLGLILPIPMADTIGPVLAWSSFLLMFIGGWIVIVLSVRGIEEINQPAHS